jgi:cell division protein FtsZ
MIERGIQGVEFVAINTDAQSLMLSNAPQRLRIGDKLTKGLGGGTPGSARRPPGVREESRSAEGRGHGLRMRHGRRHGNGRALHCQDRRVRRIDDRVVTKPFSFDGARQTHRKDGIKRLKSVDTLIVIPNDRLLQVVTKGDDSNCALTADDVLPRASRHLELIRSWPDQPGLRRCPSGRMRAAQNDVHCGAATTAHKTQLSSHP